MTSGIYGRRESRISGVSWTSAIILVPSLVVRMILLVISAVQAAAF
jgi:hypothetical protein